MDSILAGMDAIFDKMKSASIAEGRRIEFFSGKRRLKNGEIKKTGHQYWQWVYRDPDTGKRKRPYGGRIETVPNAYQYRRREYEARISDRGDEPIADDLP